MSSTHTESRPEESVVERTKEKGKEAAEQGLEKAKEAGGQTRDYSAASWTSARRRRASR